MEFTSKRPFTMAGTPQERDQFMAALTATIKRKMKTLLAVMVGLELRDRRRRVPRRLPADPALYREDGEMDEPRTGACPQYASGPQGAWSLRRSKYATRAGLANGLVAIQFGF